MAGRGSTASSDRWNASPTACAASIPPASRAGSATRSRCWSSASRECCSLISSCVTRTNCRSTRSSSPAFPPRSPSTPRRASPPTPTGRTTAANRPCRISRRWSRWRSTTSRRRPRASPSPRRWCAASPAGRPRPSATSGSMSRASPTTCSCRSAWSSRWCSFRRA